MDIKLPGAPYLFSGAVGGPCVMFLVTPFRNGLTIGAQDAQSTVVQIYKRVGARGFVNSWAGGIYPAVAACPQFLTLGPLYHLVQSNFNNTAFSTFAASAVETAITYGPETKNGHLAWNLQKPGAISVVQPVFKPFGPAVSLHFGRNLLATAGLRLFNEPMIEMVKSANEKSGSPLGKGTCTVLGDLCGNICGSTLSMPLHLAYCYMITSPDLWKASASEKSTAIQKFVVNQYTKDGSFSGKTLRRDIVLRAMYIAVSYTMYSTLERAIVANWKSG